MKRTKRKGKRGNRKIRGHEIAFSGKKGINIKG